MTDLSSPSAQPFLREMHIHEHIVQFSKTDTSLIDAAFTFIKTGWEADEACIVVATQSHSESLEQMLQAKGLNIHEAQEQQRYFSLDAATTLARFMVNGEPDPTRFFSILGAIIEQAASGGRRVRIFGEMVALLWEEGNQAAMLRLEQLWNELSNRYIFTLLCSYAIRSFDGKDHEAAFAEICSLHSRVFMTEHSASGSDYERLHALALLQQKANSLEIEIAERKKAEERLRVLAAIVESSDDAILSKDLQGIITSWNAAAERIYGYSATEIIGQSVTRLFPSDRQDEFRLIMTRIQQGERVKHFETTRVRKNGSAFSASVTVSPVKDSAGIIVGASDITRDITEQKKLEARSRRLFTSNLIGIFVADVDGTMLEVNDAFLDLLGYTRGEWETQASHSPSIAAFLASEAPETWQINDGFGPREMALRQKGGQKLPVLMAMTCLEHGTTCIGFVLDISERKELEQRKDDFISMASHELKTPVTSLKGFLGLLQRLSGDLTSERALHYLARMDAQIDKLTNLINDLLDISKIQAGHLVYREEIFAIENLAREIVESVQETTRNHHLQFESQAQVQVLGDRDRIGQILSNLLTNAIKYSPQGQPIVIRLTTEEKQVLLSVQDCGPGIAREHQMKIFERFYQVSDSEKTYPGLGIGLYISSEIARRHRGHLWVESEEGKGATFYLSLPIFTEERNSFAEVSDE